MSHRNSEGRNFHWDTNFRPFFAWNTSKFRLGQEFEQEKLYETKFGSKLTGTPFWEEKWTRTRFKEEKSTRTIIWANYSAWTKCCTKLDWDTILLYKLTGKMSFKSEKLALKFAKNPFFHQFSEKSIIFSDFKRSYHKSICNIW